MRFTCLMVVMLSFFCVANSLASGFDISCTEAQNACKISDWPNAIKAGKAAVKQAAVEFGAGSPEEVKALLVLGEIFRDKGNTSESARIYSKALAQTKKFRPQSYEIPSILVHMSENALSAGDFATCEKLLQEAVTQEQSTNTQSIKTLIALGKLYLQTENFEKVISTCGASCISDPNLSAQDRAHLMLILGDAQFASGNKAEALLTYKDAELIYRSLGQEAIPGLMTSLQRIGSTYFALNRQTRGGEAYKEALAIHIKYFPVDINSRSQLFDGLNTYVKTAKWGSNEK